MSRRTDHGRPAKKENYTPKGRLFLTRLNSVGLATRLMKDYEGDEDVDAVVQILKDIALDAGDVIDMMKRHPGMNDILHTKDLPVSKPDFGILGGSGNG